MSLPWLFTLLIYGYLHEWQIDPLFWWLLITLFVQDMYDVSRKVKR